MHLARVSPTEASSEGKDNVSVQGDQQTRKTWTALSLCGWFNRGCRGVQAFLASPALKHLGFSGVWTECVWVNSFCWGSLTLRLMDCDPHAPLTNLEMVKVALTSRQSSYSPDPATGSTLVSNQSRPRKGRGIPSGPVRASVSEVR